MPSAFHLMTVVASRWVARGGQQGLFHFGIGLGEGAGRKCQQARRHEDVTCHFCDLHVPWPSAGLEPDNLRSIRQTDGGRRCFVPGRRPPVPGGIVQRRAARAGQARAVAEAGIQPQGLGEAIGGAGAVAGGECQQAEIGVGRAVVGVEGQRALERRPGPIG